MQPKRSIDKEPFNEKRLIRELSSGETQSNSQKCRGFVSALDKDGYGTYQASFTKKPTRTVAWRVKDI